MRSAGNSGTASVEDGLGLGVTISLDLVGVGEGSWTFNANFWKTK